MSSLFHGATESSAKGGREDVLWQMSQKLAQPQRKSDRVGHQDRELPRLHPVDAARRQPRADPEVLEEHLQNTDDDLVALQCTARQERQRRGTITIGNPVHGAFQPNGYVNRSRDMVFSCRLPALVFSPL